MSATSDSCFLGSRLGLIYIAVAGVVTAAGTAG